MSNTIIIILLIALILVIALLFFVVLHRKQSTTAPVTDSKELTDLKDLVSRIKERTDNVANEVTRSGKTIDDLHNRSTKITNINDEVKKLTDVFLNSKARGNIGENILHNILEGIYGTHFPECIQEQYIPDPENSNNRIDAVIKTPNQLIGIDSKFPYDNYRKYIDEADKKKYLDLFNKDVKNRIKEVEKYFNKETNLNYIILYIPSDEIFNFINEKLFETYLYGIAKNIYICSSSILAPLLRIMLNNTLTANYEQKLQNSVEVLQQIVDLIVKFSENWNDYQNELLKLIDKNHKLVNAQKNILQHATGIVSDKDKKKLYLAKKTELVEKDREIKKVIAVTEVDAEVE